MRNAESLGALDPAARGSEARLQVVRSHESHRSQESHVSHVSHWSHWSHESH